MAVEQALAVDGAAGPMPAILHRGSTDARQGVVIIVGGPQYRAGSHRQFVLLARALAGAGIPVLRFDYRGMGDAAGALSDFTAVDDDIARAIDTLVEREPGVEGVILWGLCDAASAALFYGWRDERVIGMVLLNPWVRTEAGEARVYLRHYYLRRVLSADFWRKLLHGRVRWTVSMGDFVARLGRARSPTDDGSHDRTELAGPLPERMAGDLERFQGPVLFILSGRDLTAAEFRDTVEASPRWQGLMRRERVERVELEAADHTFSRREWRDEVARRTVQWIRGLDGAVAA